MTSNPTLLVDDKADTTVSVESRRRGLGAAGWIGLVLLVVIGGVTLLAPWLVGDPLKQNFDAILQSPSAAHPFGTDELGRDLLARVVHGGRTALTITLVAAVVSATFGLVLALLGALFGGWVDQLAGRLADIQLTVPSIVLAIVILSFVGNSFLPIVVVLILGSWVLTFRVIRSHAVAVVQQLYVEAARVSGAGRGAIAWRHLLPSVLPLWFVALTLSASTALLLESGLGFLGLGVQPPQPDWGQLVSAGQSRLGTASWLSLFPGIALVLTIVGFQLLGDGLAERAQGPRTRRRKATTS